MPYDISEIAFRYRKADQPIRDLRTASGACELLPADVARLLRLLDLVPGLIDHAEDLEERLRMYESAKK